MRTVVILCNRFSKYNAHYIFVNLDDNVGNQNEGGVNKLNSSVRPSINILHDNQNNGDDEVPAVFIPTDEGNSLDESVFHSPKHFTHSVSGDETLPHGKSDVREAQTLLNSNDSNNNKTSNGSSCTDLDHQMDDTQLLEDTVVQVVSNKSSDNHAKEETVEKLKNEAPSSPVASSSVKFVHSKTSATGSPLNRPHRSFSSPACSPTTGILKRNRGKSETPSPPGKVANTLLIQ